MSNMRHRKHKQRKLSRWLNPERVFLKKEILNRLREFDFYEKEDFKKRY